MINKNINTISGVVISVTPFKETSAICSIITSNGLESIFVSNAYKVKNSLKPLLIPFNYLSIEYSTSSDKLLIAKGCEIIKDYSPLISSYKNNLFLQCLIQIITFSFNYNEHFSLDFFLLILDSINNKKNLLTLLLLFVGRVYYDLGIKQNVSSCIICNNEKNIISYSLNEGGFICNKCLNKNHNFINKNKNQLFIFKYIFSEVSADSLNKEIPLEDGIKVLIELTRHLESYFGINKLTSIDIFANYLLNN